MSGKPEADPTPSLIEVLRRVHAGELTPEQAVQILLRAGSRAVPGPDP